MTVQQQKTNKDNRQNVISNNKKNYKTDTFSTKHQLSRTTHSLTK